MDTMQIISLILGSNIANTLATWFISRRKTNAEAGKVVAEADITKMATLEKQLNFYKDLIQAYTEELQDYIQLAETNRLELLRLKRVVGKIVNDVCLSRSCSKRIYMDDIQVETLMGGKDELKIKEDIQGK